MTNENGAVRASSDVSIITLGCRLNTYESEVMRGHADKAGLEDAVIINTCAVTGEAVRQALQTIRRVRRERPDAKIIVTGCAAQIEPERFAEIEAVDHVIGNGEKMQAATFQALASGSAGRMRVNDIMSVKETASHMIGGFGTRTRAYVQVQNGCDHRCTFCIIPYGRGPSRSVAAGEIVGEIRKLVENGYREVVLTGVDITSYGRDLPGQPTLGNLVRRILKLVPELARLRLSSIDQVEVDDEFWRALAEEERLMPHLHLSMQSGDDMVLKRMKRRHLRADAISFCDKARKVRSDVVFGADLIAGFPTETVAMFENTLDLVSACGLTYLHVFPFSPREGTPAAKMPQVTRRAVKERAQRLREEGDVALRAFLDAQTGREAEILLEKSQFGRTQHFAETNVDVAGTAGGMLRARITGNDGRRLRAEVVS